LFLIEMSLVALWTSPWWRRATASIHPPRLGLSRRGAAWLWGVTALIFVQLMIGAEMRHQHAGLAVPDFPLAYGKLWPPTDPAFLDQVNRSRLDTRGFNPITAFQVRLHMTHRIAALAIVIGVAGFVVVARRRAGPGTFLRRMSWVWLATVTMQGLLGAVTVWSNKAADVATLHVIVGASTLVEGALMLAPVMTVGLRRHESSVSQVASLELEDLRKPPSITLDPAR
jgi:cytochrome c oxidase assembly protein subunit 15